MLPRMMFLKQCWMLNREFCNRLQEWHTIRKTLTADEKHTHIYTVYTYIYSLQTRMHIQMHADANTHTQTPTYALTNPNQSLRNVLPAMQGNNMSFTTI